jgi:putative Mg2+ transporter-C (MgtC) family protein
MLSSGATALGALPGQGWTQVGELLLAFGLSSLIGWEREYRQKSAGLRTHTIVGVASALIMLVSKYGFSDVLNGHISLDPSRVAAQIVSGIGFIGGGLIFVRRDAVRGLTTAAVVWLTAAVGMAAGAGLPVLAVLVTAVHFVIVFGYAPLAARMPHPTEVWSELLITYVDGHGTLRTALAECTKRGFAVSGLATHPIPEEAAMAVTEQLASVLLQVRGRSPLAELAADLAEFDGVLAVRAIDENTGGE